MNNVIFFADNVTKFVNWGLLSEHMDLGQPRRWNQLMRHLMTEAVDTDESFSYTGY